MHGKQSLHLNEIITGERPVCCGQFIKCLKSHIHIFTQLSILVILYLERQEYQSKCIQIFKGGIYLSQD